MQFNGKPLTVFGTFATVGICDDEVGGYGWSSQNIVDKLCPSFAVSTNAQNMIAQCEPLAGTEVNYLLKLADTSTDKIKIWSGGKNLLGMEGTTAPAGETVNYRGVNVTRNADTGLIAVSGTATGPKTFTLGDVLLPAGSYKYCVGFTGSELLYGWVKEINEDGSSGDYIVHGAGITSPTKAFTLTKPTKVRAQIYFKAGTHNKIIYPMIVVEGTYLSFEKYNGTDFYIDKTDSSVYQGSFPVNEGVKIIYSPHGILGLTGTADPKVLFEKLTNAIIALGGNI